MTGPILALVQSGAEYRAAVFSVDRRLLADSREELTRSRSGAGSVEFDPEEIWSAAITTSRAALVQARVEPGAVAAVGLAGDPGITILWERDSGRPIYNAIAAADRRTEGQCRALRQADIEPLLLARAGLGLDTSRAAPKLAWLLDNIDGARRAAEAGQLAYGCLTTFLLWRLTDGRVHAIDAASAAATAMFNLTEQSWDATLLGIFGVPPDVLPEVFDNATYFGAVDAGHFGGSGPVGVHGMIASDQAALLGQAGVAAGSLSLSVDSGCSAVLATGAERPSARDRDQIGIACRLDGKVSFARVAGNNSATDAFRWAKGTFGLTGPNDADRLVASADPELEIYIVPRGITAEYPWFQSPTPGLILGMTTEATAPDLVRATLESFVFAANDLVEAMTRHSPADSAQRPAKVAGGLAQSNWTMQFLADILDRPVERPTIGDAVALGVAWLAGTGAGIWPDSEAFISSLAVERRFEPRIDKVHRHARINGWRRAVGLALAAKPDPAKPISASGAR